MGIEFYDTASAFSNGHLLFGPSPPGYDPLERAAMGQDPSPFQRGLLVSVQRVLRHVCTVTVMHYDQRTEGGQFRFPHGVSGTVIDRYGSAIIPRVSCVSAKYWDDMDDRFPRPEDDELADETLQIGIGELVVTNSGPRPDPDRLQQTLRATDDNGQPEAHRVIETPDELPALLHSLARNVLQLSVDDSEDFIGVIHANTVLLVQDYESLQTWQPAH